jgi:hypothetical protein
MTLPKATPISSAAPTLPRLKIASQVCRHRGEACLLRNSMATARKMSVVSSSMNAV